MSKPLRMLQLQPDPFKVAAWMDRQHVTRPGHDDGYGWHALLTAAFGESAPSPFRVFDPGRMRQDARSRAPRVLTVLAYSDVGKSQLVATASVSAEPAVVEALALETNAFAEKRVPETFTAGQHFGFEVLARPAVRQDRDGDRRKSREVDAFLAAVQKADRDLGPRGQRPELDRSAVYKDWLAQRLGAAATIDRVEIAQRERALLLRRGAHGADATSRPLQTVSELKRRHGEGGGGPSVVFEGVLMVREPQAFAALLARGIGRHRAFGYGMLLLKPAR